MIGGVEIDLSQVVNLAEMGVPDGLYGNVPSVEACPEIVSGPGIGPGGADDGEPCQRLRVQPHADRSRRHEPRAGRDGIQQYLQPES